MHTPPSGVSHHLPRRAFVVGAAAAALTAACSGGGDSGAADTGETASSDIDQSATGLSDDGTLWLQASFADGFRVPPTLAAGRPERAPFVFSDANGLPAVNGVPDAVDMMLTSPDGTTTTISVPKRSDGIPTPYYPLVFTATEPGTHQVTVDVNGGDVQQVDFMVADPSEIGLVVPGDQLRPVATPTFDDARGFDPICTRFDPCPFHEISLDEAMTNGRPTALLIATPGYCQTAICGPVVELLMQIDPADMNVIHAEVYTEPERINDIGLSPELLGPVITTYAMDFEPSFIVADANAMVTSRLDYAFDITEMADAVATASS